MTLSSSCPLAVFGCDPEEWMRTELGEPFYRFLAEKLNWEKEDLYAYVPVIQHSSVVGITLRDRFMALRKKLGEMRRHQSFPTNLHEHDPSPVGEIRRLLCIFTLHVIRTVAAMKSDSGDSNSNSRVVREYWGYIRGIALQLGYMPDDASYRSMDHELRYVDNSTTRIRYHAHLELITLAVICVNEIQRTLPYEIGQLDRDVICGESAENSASLSTDITSWAFRNIIGVAAEQFSQLSASNWLQKLMSKPFVCSCPAACLLLIQRLSNRSSDSQSTESCIPDNIKKTVESFKRKTLNNNIEMLRSDTLFMRYIPNVGEDVNGFTLWLLYHISQTARRNGLSDGILASNSTFDKFVANKILQPVLLNLESSWNESRARFVLACVYRLQTAGSAQLESVALLADFFLKNTNYNFSLEPNSVDSIQVLHKSATEWAAKWIGFGAGEVDPVTMLRSETSFEMFVRILALSLAQSPDQAWKRFKGRFLAKFQAKYFESLTTAGWSRFFDLMLVLVGRLGGTADFSPQLVEVIGEDSWSTKSSVEKSIVVCKGFAAMTLLYQNANLNNMQLVRKLAAEFERLSRHMKTARIDAGITSTLWSWILAYFDTLEGLFSHNPECLSAIASLINNGFSDLFQVALDETKQGKLHATVQLLFDLYAQHFPHWKSDLKSSTACHHQTFLNALFSNILPTVRRLVVSRNQKVPVIFSSWAVQFTVFSGDVVRHNANDSTSSLFQTFGLVDEVHPDVTVRFLTEILPLTDVCKILKKDQWTESRIIHSWIRCILELGEYNEAVARLSWHIAKIPEVQSLIPARTSPDEIFRSFIEGCGNAFEQAKTFDQKMALQRRFQIYFSDLPKYVASALRPGPLAQPVTTTIGTVGWILQHCAPILYVRAKLNNTLHQLVNSILLAADNGAVVQSIQQEFPFYFAGIAQLNVNNDPQISNLLQNIIRTYLVKFAYVPAEQHPLLISMQKIASTNPDTVVFTIDSICRSFFAPVTPPQHTFVAVNLISKILSIFPENELQYSVVECVFANSLEAYLKGSETVTRGCFQLIQTALNWLESNRSDAVRMSVTQIVRTKCLAHCNTPPGNLFTVLDMMAQVYPELLSEVLPFLTQMFERSSSYPAYQTAKARQSYMAILEKLGPLGAPEFAKLSSTSS